MLDASLSYVGRGSRSLAEAVMIARARESHLGKGALSLLATLLSALFASDGLVGSPGPCVRQVCHARLNRRPQRLLFTLRGARARAGRTPIRGITSA